MELEHSDSNISINIRSSLIETSMVQNVLPITAPKVTGITLDLEAVIDRSLGTPSRYQYPHDDPEKSFDENCKVSTNKQNRDVIFIVDTSGSMHNVISQVAQTIDRLASHLTESDRLCVISFSSEAIVEVPLQSVADGRSAVATCVANLSANGNNSLKSSLIQIRIY
jgi:Mg-chelatase subunit ChlD